MSADDVKSTDTVAGKAKKPARKSVKSDVFITVYQSCNSVKEVAEKLGCTVPNVYTRAKSLIKRAKANNVTLSLKKFAKESHTEDFAALAELAAKSLKS